MDVVVQKIEKLLDQKLEDTDIFPVEVKLLPGNKLQIFLDSDSNLTIEKCAEISRYLQYHIENEQLLPETYKIEVSSPGVGQPLKFFRQYKKNIGRNVEVTQNDETKKEGTLLYVDENKITIEEEVKLKGTKKEKIQTDIPLENIKKIIVKITF